MIRFGEHLPDQAALDNPGVTEALNVVPLTRIGDSIEYGPIGQISSISDALSSRPFGAYSGADASGDTYTFAATDDNLFRLSAQAWNNVSKSVDAYNVDSERLVNFAQYGDRVIAALGISDPLQVFQVGTDSAFSDLAAAAPRAFHAAAIGDFLMVGNTWDSTDGHVPNRVWWSAINNVTDWPTIGSATAASAQSDRQDIAEGGAVQALTGAVGGADGALWTERSIYRITYAGPPTVFRFDEVERGRGTPAPYSVVNIGSEAFYLSEDGFYRFDGARSIPIGDQKVDRTFFSDLDQNYFYRIKGAADPINKVALWIYPGSGNTGGRPNRIIVYKWSIGAWSIINIETDMIFNGITVGFTLEELDQFGTLETLPASLDSRLWAGGRLVLSAFTTGLKLGAFTGSELEATITTEEAGGPQRLFVQAIRPYADSADMSVALCTRDTPFETPAQTTYRSVDTDGQSHFNVDTRYARAKVRISAGSSWTRAQGIDLMVKQAGRL